MAGPARAATPLALAPEAVAHVELYDVSRDAVRVGAPSSLPVDLGTVQTGTRLVTAIAVAETLTTPLRFRIVLETGDERTEIYSRVVDLADARDRRWIDVGRDLTPFAGRAAVARFEVAGSAADTRAYWAAPAVLDCGTGEPSVLVLTASGIGSDRRGAPMPRLDAFARAATIFTRAYAAAPATLPALRQMLTGRYFPPEGEGILTALGAGAHAITSDAALAAALRADVADARAAVARAANAHAATSAALRHLTAAGRCHATVYVHYGAETPTRIARRLADPETRRVAALDREIGRVLRGITRRGRLARTLVVVTADHAQPRDAAGGPLADATLHIPLLVRWPGIAHGRTVDALVGAVDVGATVAAIVGRAGPELDGASLAALADGTRSDPAARVLFARADPAGGIAPVQMVRDGHTKVVRSIADGRLVVYDLAADPEERRDVGAAAPQARLLTSALDGIRAGLAETGYQLRLRSRQPRPTAYAVRLTSATVPLTNLDRVDLEADDTIAFDAATRTITWRGTLEPGGEDRLRFDAAPSAPELGIALTLDDAPAAASAALRLGADAVPATAAIDLADPRLAGEPPQRAASGGESPVAFALWRAEPPAAGPDELPEPDGAIRERLRELGYVD